MSYIIEVRGGEWAGIPGDGRWRPACGGTLNQTGGSDAFASTFESRTEAEEIMRQMIDGENPEPGTEFRVREVES
jgi:hypothetical protein